MSVDFKQIYLIEDFRVLYELKTQYALALDSDEKAKIRNQFDEFSHKKLVSGIQNFIVSKINQKELRRIENCDGHKITFITAWNTLIDNPNLGAQQKDNYIQNVLNGLHNFSYMIAARKLWTSDLILPRLTESQEYEALCDEINNGNFPWWLTDSQKKCDKTGEYLTLQFNNWCAEFGKIKTINGESVFTPVIQSIKKDEIFCKPITFKTGNLLIADWFRIKQLNNAVENVNYETDVSVDSEVGIVRRTSNLLEKLNIINLCIDEPSSEIHANEDGIFCSEIEFDDEDEQLKRKSSIGCIDNSMWWVTIIERENLEEIIAKTCAIDEAKQIVSKYIEDNAVLQISVKPGTHYLYFSGDKSRFKDEIQSKEIITQNIGTPLFLLAKEELRPALDLKRKLKVK